MDALFYNGAPPFLSTRHLPQRTGATLTSPTIPPTINHNDTQPDKNPNDDINPPESDQDDTSNTNDENNDNNLYLISDSINDDNGQDINQEERVDDDDEEQSFEDENQNMRNEDTCNPNTTEQNIVLKVVADDTEQEHDG